MHFRSMLFVLSILAIALPALAGDLKIWPVFSAALDGPRFMIDYTNNSDHVIDIPKLIQGSSIVLDGLEYPLVSFRFGGSCNLRQGETWTYKFSLDSYILGAQKREYSKKLGRWRWQTAVKPGKHILVLKFAGQESKPVSFLWEGNVPLLTK